MAALAGVDGCRAGWVVATTSTDGGTVSAFIAADVPELLERLSHCALVAIDIPIGLPDAGARACDVAARRVLRAPRASSVFPAPVRAALHARTHAEAAALSLAAHGRSLSVQAFNILSRIRDVDHHLQRSGEWRRRLHEVHPELCFHHWNGGQSMRHAKRTAGGRAERRALVDAHFGDAYAAARAVLARRDAADDDVLDAFAALWSAKRAHAGGATRVPAMVETDSTGIVMEILA